MTITKEEPTFKQILSGARQVFRDARPGVDCPDLEILTGYGYGNLSAEKTERISAHVAACESCQMVVMRVVADHYFWNETLQHNPEEALFQALGKEGSKTVRNLMRKAAAKRSVSPAQKFASKIEESMVAWASPLWQPMYAGEVVTAADAEEQSTRFEMDYGEYINLSCHWQEEKEGQPYIDLAWQANLLQPSTLWARFIDPEDSTVLSEILLGTELEGKKRILSSELSFNPSTEKWAIAIVVAE